LLKQPEVALRVAQDGLANAGEAHEIYDAVGVALGDLGRHAEAIEAFNEGLARSPNDPNTNYNLSISLLSLGRYEEAYKSLQRALTLEPTFPKALVMLSRLDLEAGRLDVAEAYVRALYESQSGVPQARQLMGAWYMRSGLRAEKQRDLVGAEQHYRAGLKIDPDEPELHSSLGVLYLTHGRIPEAVEPLENYRRMKPEDPRASLYLGQAYAQVGRTSEAKNILSQGIVQAEKVGNAATAEFCREILRHL
jgi:protein O-GlcNAc transferase